jgi:hypothetical protein
MTFSNCAIENSVARQLDQELVPIAKLVAVGHGFHSKSADSDRSGGLQHTIYLCKDAKVMLSINICVPFGLFNGALGLSFN